jgi:AraC-like DNA-binding protein
MIKSQSTSSVAIVALNNLLHDNGWSDEEVESQTGIRCTLLKDPDAKIPMVDFLQLWDLTVKVSQDPALGLHLRQHYGKSLKHFVVTLILASSSLDEAVENWIRFHRLICETDRIEIIPDSKYYQIAYYNINLELQNRYLPEHHLSLALSYCQQFMGRSVFPDEVHFRHADPGYSKEYQKFFHCPVLFEQKDNLIIAEKVRFNRKQTEDDLYLQSILIKHAENELRNQTAPQSYIDDVREVLQKNMARGCADIKTTSSALNMDRTTLHRHLQKENTSFSKILLSVRKQLAREYLKQNFSVHQTAFLLGFSDPSAFQRAFRRWFEMPPGQYRKALENSRADDNFQP